MMDALHQYTTYVDMSDIDMWTVAHVMDPCVIHWARDTYYLHISGAPLHSGWKILLIGT